ncbi:MAG: hypothetical protein ACI8UO_005488, partial [Verrucomicrobiales bacterium]
MRNSGTPSYQFKTRIDNLKLNENRCLRALGALTATFPVGWVKFQTVLLSGIVAPLFKAPLIFMNSAKLLLAGLSCLIALAVPVAQAATFSVTTTVDELDATSADGTGVSLREAIRDANATGADDSIFLPAGTYRLTRTGAGEDANATGDLDIAATATGGKLTIVGAGNGAVIDATGLGDRILHSPSGADVALRGFTLTGGNAGFGGALVNSGTLVVSDCTFHSNSSPANTNTGAIAAGGTVTIERCTFHDNTSGRDGGAVTISGDVDIINSTFNGNTATGNGGAIFIFSGTLDLIQSTVSGNTATGSVGGGVWNLGQTLNLTNSIVAGNNAATDPDISGAISNQTGQNLTFGDPQLGSLRDNGGQTLTMAPALGSPAIDPASGDQTSALTTDQRGAPRVNGGIVDIGAVERDDDLTFQHLLAQGDTIEVMNADDSGAGSLRQALADAAAGSAFGTHITFNSSLNGATITLATELDVADNAHPLDIDASALSGGVILSGNNVTRVWDFGTDTRTRLSTLTITGGFSLNGGG